MVARIGACDSCTTGEYRSNRRGHSVIDTTTKPRKFFPGFFQRRECVVPTWQGWLLIAFVVLGLIVFAAKEIHPFLAMNAMSHDLDADTALVVEGWLPDYALDEVVTEFRRSRYRKLYVTGGPMERGIHLSEFGTYADLGAEILIRKGLATSVVQAVPSTEAGKDRTYNSAVVLHAWLRRHGVSPSTFHVISLGAHARRTRLLFEKAMGEGAIVDITSVRNIHYDPTRWWLSSEGVRTVVDETFAYLYARLLFRPPN